MKKMLLSFGILFFIFPQFLFAQDGWVKSIPFLDSLVTFKMITTNDGGYVYSLRIDPPQNSNSFFDDEGIHLIKIDQDGDTLWTQQVIEDDYHLFKLSPTPDNGILASFQVNMSNGIFHLLLIKLDQDGNEQWSTYYYLEDPNEADSILDFIPTSDGGYLAAGKKNGVGDSLMLIKKLDANLNEIWTFPKPHNYSLNKLIELSSGDYAVGGKKYDTQQAGPLTGVLIRLNSNGSEIFDKHVGGMPSWAAFDLHEIPDGSFLFFTIGSSPKVQIKHNSNGDSLWVKEMNPDIPEGIIYKTVLVENGVIFCDYKQPSSVLEDLFFVKTNFDGDVEWARKTHLFPIESFTHSNTNGIIGVGFEPEYILGGIGTEVFLFKTDSLGFIFPNKIIGNVRRDLQSDCLIDSSDIAISNWIISAESGVNTYYTVSDSLGEYLISLDTGDYQLTIHPPNNLWTACENEIEITVESNETIEQDFPMGTMFDCPALNISSSFPSARPCFENRQTLSYCNQGTDTAEDAYLEIEIDSNLTYVSSSISLTSQVGNILTFDLGDLLIGECGNFYIDYLLDCNAVLGESICIESHIYPDSTCTPIPNWNGAFVEVDAHCQDSIITFYLENVGLGDMPMSKDYIVIEDAILLISNDFQLLAGEQDSFTVTTNGATFVMAAEQVENAPGDPFPTAWVEGCTTNGSNNFSIGLINQFPLGDDSPYLDIDCTTTTNSYDPNDKQGFPIGYGNEHFIRPNTDLEYLIRFQNTGTDTAFTVVIRDTIAPELDIPTIQVGASSHPMEWRIYGENILEFTFNVIMLPDSNVNEPASHGFVEFKISQKDDLPLGTVIKNKAAIYFDYNDPIITNETFHTLGENFITVSTQRPIEEDYSLLVRPNPFQEFAIFEMKKEINNGLFELYDVSGKLAWQQKFNGSQFELKRNDLTAGIYFYKISENGNAINSGKVIIQ